MPTLVNYSGNNNYTKGSLRSMDSSPFFSVLDVYTRPSKRIRTSGSNSFFFENEKNPSIEILPDECLYEIFRRLSSGKAQSAAACVSKRWLEILSNVRPSEKVKVNDGQETDGYLMRSLEGKKASDTRLAAIAVGTSARGGLGRLSVRGSSGVTSIGFSAIARGCPGLKALSLWNLPFIGDEALIEISKECRLLESLDLSHCFSISDTGLSLIVENCPNLSSLTIDSCKRIGDNSLLSAARSCPNLQSISIKDCPLIGDPGVINLVSSTSSVLRKVKLQALRITDLALAAIGRFGRSISNLALTGLQNVTQKGFWEMGNERGLESLTSLTVISCYGVNDISLEAIGNGCRILKHISVKKCCFLSDKGLISFSESAGFLENLHLEECDRITQRSIFRVLSNRNSKLKSFSVVKCIGIKDLADNTFDFRESQTLRSLTIKNCIGFGNASLATIGRLCPNLRYLDLCGLCGLTHVGLDPFLKTRPAGLVKVNLSGCLSLTDGPVVEMVRTHGGSLETLNLDGCWKITDRSLAAIGENCMVLKDLDVSKCGITDSGVFWLSGGGSWAACGGLRVLSMAGCARVSSKSVVFIEKLGETLVGLDLRGCDLIGSGAIESLAVGLWRCDVLS